MVDGLSLSCLTGPDDGELNDARVYDSGAKWEMVLPGISSIVDTMQCQGRLRGSESPRAEDVVAVGAAGELG